MPTLTTLVNFNGTNGAIPTGSLIIGDAAGDLFGTTAGGGMNSLGTVFEIAETGSGYATTATTLASFNGTNGTIPKGSLIIGDAAGDLFGTTAGGGDGYGTAFEILNTGSGYITTPATLFAFDGTDGSTPEGGVVANGVGNLFGTTNGGGANSDGTIFEITNSGGSTLASFNGTDGQNPVGNLTGDASGDLFGTTAGGGANSDGTVFELANSSSGYSGTPLTLVSFNGANGQNPLGGLVTDAAGDLFGTTKSGGAYGDGTVFEIANTSNGYASTPNTLASFNGSDGQSPQGSLIIDAAGDLFGTTAGGGANSDGTVFELANSSSGYSGTPSTLVNFNGTNGQDPLGGLIADASGDLFGTTEGGGANSDGTVFELSGAGFQVALPPNAGTTADMILLDTDNGNYEIYDIGGNAILAAYPLVQVALEWQVAGLGGFYGTDTSDMILRDSNTGAFEVYDISNNTVTSVASMGQVGLEWTVSGFGDFSSNPGETDMLMRATSGPNPGNFEVYDISNNAVTTVAALGNVGLQWQVAGFGDFSGNPGESDMLMRASSGANAGNFEVYDIRNNAVISAVALGHVGLEWQVAGFGDFSGNANETDMLMRNTNTGAFEIYDISHNAVISAAAMGQAGLEWTVAGFGDFSGNANETDMASFGTSGAVNGAPGAVLDGTDTSQQTLLTLPQHQ